MSIKNKIRGIREIWQFENRWNLALNRILFPNEKINIYRFKGLEILTDHAAGDANGAREVLTSDMYSKYLPKMDLRNNINVLDLGANNGGFLLMLRAEGIGIAKAFSVELNPQTFARLRFNLDRNFQGEAEALNLAVCGSVRTIEFNPQPEGSVADNIYVAGTLDSRRIDGITLDRLYEMSFGDDEVDLCKIDVEGAEFEIFTSGTSDSIRKCRYLLMEIHHSPEKQRSIVIEALEKLNFRQVDSEGKTGNSHYVHFFVNRSF